MIPSIHYSLPVSSLHLSGAVSKALIWDGGPLAQISGTNASLGSLRQ